MNNTQNGTTVIVLKDGKKIEVKENAAVVNAKYNQADYLDTEELMSWMGSYGDRPFPRPNNHFKVIEKKTGEEISLSPQEIQQIIVDPGDLPMFTSTGNTKVFLNNDKEFVAEENFDTIFAIWNAILMNNANTQVLVLTEKMTKKRLAILAKDIVKLKEM